MVVLAALASCGQGGEAAKAERHYDFVKKNGTLDDLCAAANEVKDAYNRAEDAEKYKLWQVFADSDCLTARQEGGYLPADDAERKKIQDAAAKDAMSSAEAALEAAGNAVDAASDAVANDTPDEPMDNE